MKYTYSVSNEVYDIEKLDQASQDFIEVTTISYCADSQELSIQADTNEEAFEIFNEFMNYVLSL